MILEDGEDNTILPAMALLYALLRNPSIDKPILQTSNLYPLRMSKAKQLLDALTATSPRRDDEVALPFDSPEKGSQKVLGLPLSYWSNLIPYMLQHDSLFESRSPPPALLLEEVKSPHKSIEPVSSVSASDINNTADKPTNVNSSMESSSEGSVVEHDDNRRESSEEHDDQVEEEEESGEYEDSPDITESEEEEENKKRRIKSAVMEWMSDEEREKRSAQAEKEKAERREQTRNRRNTEVQPVQRIPASEDWTEKLLNILVTFPTMVSELGSLLT